ncbi:MAG: hypothetical protein ACE5EU_14250 [Paracoccaceae bacterium]
MQRQHDLGGQPAGQTNLDEHEAEPWAKTITAVVGALRQHDLMRVDELRRALEDLPTDAYAQHYFERWAEAMCNLMEEKGLLTRAEVEKKMTAIRARLENAA